MGQITIKTFHVNILKEGDYFRLYITCPTSFKGRIKKRVGNDNPDELEQITFHLKYELENYFSTNDISKEKVAAFVDNFVSLKVKFNASIFDYFPEFIESKKKTINRNTKNRLVKPTLTSYESAKKFFEGYLKKKRIAPHPAMINKEILDNFYYYIDGGHNYKVKLHRRIKAFITFLDGKKGMGIDPSYKSSHFTEQYDNQDPAEDDIALTRTDILKLLDLRERIRQKKIEFPIYARNNKIPESVQKWQFEIKKENLTQCLDCFLFMVSTGQYYSDIKKAKLLYSINGNVLHLRYRRAKNGSLCRSIPVKNDELFIGKAIIEQYKIKEGSNFPIKLSLTHFNKHLERISELAGLDFKLNNKKARKTFASILYFERSMPIHLLQFLLGHKDVKSTNHYLRITDRNLEDEVDRIMFTDSLKQR
jgi:integrase